MHYTVVAYRWGWTNAHHYHVAQSSDAARACDLAEAECLGRGGKYGVVVYEWTDEETYEVHAYYPSSYGEDEPHFNQRIEMFESIGHDAHSAVTTHVVWDIEQPSKDSGLCRVEAPEWLVRAVRSRMEHCHFMTAIHHDLKQRLAMKHPARDEAESKAWVERMMAAAREAVDAELSKGSFL